MKSALVLLGALCLASYVSAVVFKGNVTVNINGHGGWEYRRAKLQALPFSVQYSSIDVERSAPRTFNVSGILGGGFFLPTQVPYAFLSTFSVDSDWQRNFTGGGGWDSASVDASLAYIATAYLRIEERSADGTVVASNSLRSGLGILGGMTWKADYTHSDDTLSSTSFVGTPSNGKWSVNITFVSSSVVGVIDLADAVVGPSSLEQVVQINNYPYQSPNNHLTLVMITASGSITDSSSATATTLSSGSGSSQIYFSASGSAVVDGKSKTVNVKVDTSSSVSDDARGNGQLLLQIAGRYGSNVQYSVVSVDFPAGAQAIAYDPSQGAGDSLPASGTQSSGAASSFAVSATISFLVLALVALLF